MRVRHLPVVQNWDCHSCSNCCREHEVAVSDAERRRIAEQGWARDPVIGRLRLFRRRGLWWSPRYTLNHRPGGGCVFLSPENRCLIHERFGAEAKPFACRLFPFVLVPAGNHWRVSLRFACPSVADNKGRPVGEHEAELNQYVRLLEQHEQGDGQALPPPPLQRGQRVDWPDLMRFVHVLQRLLADGSDRLECRLRKCVALSQLCRQAQFDKITGARLSEFLDVVSASPHNQVAINPSDVAAPTWVGRVLFRQVLAIYARKDRGDMRGETSRNPLSRLLAAWRFARGRGRVPRVNALLPDTTFAEVEAASAPLSPAAEQTLERYYGVKLQSLQFCGPTNFGLPLWDGLESLLLTFPVVLWLSRALKDRSPEDAVTRAIQLVDDHFGYNRVFATGRLRFVLRTLARRGELERLIARYSRET